eukprot:365816-Chlamydomonas_euryale.AAC.1
MLPSTPPPPQCHTCFRGITAPRALFVALAHLLRRQRDALDARVGKQLPEVARRPAEAAADVKDGLGRVGARERKHVVAKVVLRLFEVFLEGAAFALLLGVRAQVDVLAPLQGHNTASQRYIAAGEGRVRVDVLASLRASGVLGCLDTLALLRASGMLGCMDALALLQASGVLGCMDVLALLQKHGQVLGRHTSKP